MKSRVLVLGALLQRCHAIALPSAAPLRSAWGRAVFAAHHALEPHPLQSTTATLEDLANVRVPTGDSGREICAFAARPAGRSPDDPRKLPVLLVLHEFFGLNPSIVAKAQGLADELGCLAIAPDCFRGETTTFIPKAIWLALSTQQGRVNEDLDAVLAWASTQADVKPDGRVGVLGFCFGGGKAIGYTTQVRRDAATVVFYGEPVTDVSTLASLNAPVCGIFGVDDPQPTTNQAAANRFRAALEEAGVEHEVVSYNGVGHAFWKDMGQIEREEMPQIAAWRLSTAFLRNFFENKPSFAEKRSFLEFMLAEEEAAGDVEGEAV